MNQPTKVHSICKTCRADMGAVLTNKRSDAVRGFVDAQHDDLAVCVKTMAEQLAGVTQSAAMALEFGKKLRAKLLAVCEEAGLAVPDDAPQAVAEGAAVAESH